MSDPALIEEIRAAVSIPVMAKCRIGHLGEARVLEALGVDFIDESEVLTPADEEHHLPKHDISIPTVCGCRGLGEALRRIGEGAALIRTKGEAGTGNVVEAVRHLRLVSRELRALLAADPEEVPSFCRDLRVPLSTALLARERGRLPVPNFAAGGVATPADAALMMMLGAESVFVGSGIFKSSEPPRMATAIVNAVNNWEDATAVADASRGLGSAMPGLDIHLLTDEERLSVRGD